MKTPMSTSLTMTMNNLGPCAKKQVKCTIIDVTGERYVGENLCLNAQKICPRLPGEGYEKCVSICKQEGHAETMALKAAGSHAHGSHAYVEGHTYACQNCQESLFASGVAALTIGSPPS